MPFNALLQNIPEPTTATIALGAIGTLLRLFTDWKLGKDWSDEVGIPFAAGLIVGEALVGVGFALYYVFSGIG